MSKLKIGDKAPEINAFDENGKRIFLSDFSGKKLVLFFYPKDSTPICTVESCNLRDSYSLLKEKGFEVLGVSADTQKKHKQFISKNKLPYSLIADEDKRVINNYGVFGKVKFLGLEFNGILRTTFVISETGIIERIFDKVQSRNHAEQIISTY